MCRKAISNWVTVSIRIAWDMRIGRDLSLVTNNRSALNKKKDTERPATISWKETEPDSSSIIGGIDVLDGPAKTLMGNSP